MSETKAASIYTLILILAFQSDKMFVVHGRQAAEPMYFLLDGRGFKHTISFAVNGTKALPKHYQYFLFFNSARTVKSVGTFLFILCSLVAPSLY